MDRSFRACNTSTSKSLYAFMSTLLAHLRGPVKGKNQLKYRFGGYGSTVCFLSPTMAHPPFVHTLGGVNTPHFALTEKSRSDLLDTLKGQPFPPLGVNNIRDVLTQITTERSVEATAHHTVVLACWEPGTVTDDTWTVMQSLGSVTLVNVHEKAKRCGQNEVTPCLRGVWFLSPFSAAALAKKLKHASRSAVKPSVPKEIKPFTQYELLHISMLVFLREFVGQLPSCEAAKSGCSAKTCY